MYIRKLKIKSRKELQQIGKGPVIKNVSKCLWTAKQKTVNYNFGELLGQGTYGSVYVACSVNHQCKYVAKIQLIQYKGKPAEGYNSYYDEFDVYKFLIQSNPKEYFQSVPRLIDDYVTHCDDTKKIYAVLILERMEGTVEDLILKYKYDEAEIADIITKVYNCLLILIDNKISHNDMKAQNVLYTRENGEIAVKVTDFGWAHHFVGDDKTHANFYLRNKINFYDLWTMPTRFYWWFDILAFILSIVHFYDYDITKIFEALDNVYDGFGKRIYKDAIKQNYYDVMTAEADKYMNQLRKFYATSPSIKISARKGTPKKSFYKK